MIVAAHSTMLFISPRNHQGARNSTTLLSHVGRCSMFVSR
jgi:hypothetical protein